MAMQIEPSSEVHETAMSDALGKVLEGVRSWLEDGSSPYVSGGIGAPGALVSLCVSPSLPKTDMETEESGTITLIQQFHIPDNADRREEIKSALALNVGNNRIDKVLLLNERKYTSEELGVDSDKIEQRIIYKRLTYAEAIRQARGLEFVLLSNNDMFFDSSVSKARNSGLKTNRRMLTQLRHEYRGEKNLDDCKLFGPRPDSQDVWVWHSSQLSGLGPRALDCLEIDLGKGGCDNKVMHLMEQLSVQCFNVPEHVKTYHLHQSQIRRHHLQQKIEGPYLFQFPALEGKGDTGKFQPSREADALFNYLSRRIESGSAFILPRVAGIENETAMLGAIIAQTGKATPEQQEALSRMCATMKSNAGVSLPTIETVCLYADMYLSAFNKADAHTTWAPWGNVGMSIMNSLNFINGNFARHEKLSALSLNAYNQVAGGRPWTHALRGKRILLVTSMVDSIKHGINKGRRIYGIEMFPECTFDFVRAPLTHGDNPSRPFQDELKDMVMEIEAKKDTFDIALCACGGYGNPLCSAILAMGKSAIYVGGVLQMLFGIYGQRWLVEESDIMRIYMNEHWSRPLPEDRPQGHDKIEGGCYW